MHRTGICIFCCFIAHQHNFLTHPLAASAYVLGTQCSIHGLCVWHVCSSVRGHSLRRATIGLFFFVGFQPACSQCLRSLCM